MLPRRSLRIRLRQLNGQTASHSIASPSTNERSKSIAETAKKRARTETSSDVDAGNQPKQKKIKLFKHNLESFPIEILEEIFMRCGDVGLLNLAKTCTRFEAIAQTVFSQRYVDKFFMINGGRDGGNLKIYAALFNRFGGHIKAIQLNHVYEKGSTKNGVLKIIQSHMNRIQKLVYNKCTFQSINILSQPLENATHLVFRDVDVLTLKEFDLPECRNLVELEISGTRDYTIKSLHRTIRTNPALQRIILKNFYSSLHEKDLFSVINLVANHLKGIKELVLYDDDYEVWDKPLSASDIDRIVKLFKHLESLTVNAGDRNMIKLLPRLAGECKDLKHLGLFGYDDKINGELFSLFEQIESFHLKSRSKAFTSIDLPVKHFSNLRQLTIEILDYNKDRYSDLLPLVHQCQSLQRISIRNRISIEPKDFITADFFEKFIETTIVADRPNFQIDLADNIENVGSITANGVVWRNMLTYWMDCSKNDTNIHSLDLAVHLEKSDARKRAVDQMSLLYKIFDYLDLESLYTVAEINKRTKQFVKSCIKKRAKAQRAFIFADGFAERWLHYCD